MPWRSSLVNSVVTSAVIVAAGLVGAGKADAASWRPTVLPMPDGWRGGWAEAADGKGEYSGTFIDGNDGLSKIVIWRSGKAVVVNPPAGCWHVDNQGENSARVIAAMAEGCGEDNLHSAAYTYSGGAYHRLPPVEGYPDTYAVAINELGAVLGQAGPRLEPAVTVVWRPTGAVVVIPDTVAGQTPVDIDGDGTVLFNTDEGPYLWRAGTMSKLPVPAGHEARGNAIRAGVVVGQVNRVGEEATRAYWWTPTTHGYLSGGSRASDVNANRLAAGDLMTWRDGAPSGSVPIPSGYDTAGVGAVAPGGALLGSVGVIDSDRPYDRPAIWRWG
jgi:hypothetical protein